MLAIDEYLALRARPSGRPVMHQSWRDLLFLHFSMDPITIQELLPQGLAVDVYPDRSGRDRAWIGLVAFHMCGIRLRGLPAIPGTDAFPETNVRTYVHREGREPGVWFFSLDAANALACSVARRFWRLPYHHSSMSVVPGDMTVTYRSSRLSDASQCDLDCSLGDALVAPQPGTLEFFLIERYLLYAARAGRFWAGRVHHPPYELRKASLDRCDERVVRAAGIEPCPWEHVVYSPGVDVEVFGLQPVDLRDNRTNADRRQRPART